MPALRAHDFDKAAARVVDKFLSGGVKLADAAAEEAMAGVGAARTLGAGFLTWAAVSTMSGVGPLPLASACSE